MPGSGQSLAYVIVPSILTIAFAPNDALAPSSPKRSVSAARADAGKTAAATTATTRVTSSLLSECRVAVVVSALAPDGRARVVTSPRAIMAASVGAGAARAHREAFPILGPGAP